MTYDQIKDEFGCSLELCNLGLTLYLVGMSLGPLLFGPMSEVSKEIYVPPLLGSLTDSKKNQFYGRRPIYITSTFFFLIWLIPCAAAQNIQTLLVGRFLNGLSGSAFLGVVAGTIVDMFIPQQLLIPMTVFTGGSFVGPVIGPVMGGFISSFTDWQGV